MRTIVCPHCGEKIRLGQDKNDRSIELYYRVRAAGGKTTLREIAENTGMSYEALRKHKQRYDAAGGWGSKQKPPPVLDNKD